MKLSNEILCTMPYCHTQLFLFSCKVMTCSYLGGAICHLLNRNSYYYYSDCEKKNLALRYIYDIMYYSYCCYS